jgi:hypothetical protein
VEQVSCLLLSLSNRRNGRDVREYTVIKNRVVEQRFVGLVCRPTKRHRTDGRLIRSISINKIIKKVNLRGSSCD